MTHQKKPPPHAEIMKAYADDASLSALVRPNANYKWQLTPNLSFIPEASYFLCLPKHKDVVLNMLNGGEVQVKLSTDRAGWLDGGETEAQHSWHPESWYMLDEWESRIKPKTQKAWIAVYQTNAGFLRTTETPYESIKAIKEAFSLLSEEDFATWQFIQIEFEMPAGFFCLGFQNHMT